MGEWEPWQWLWIQAANHITGVAYYLIPAKLLALRWFLRKAEDYSGVYLTEIDTRLFIAFIASCGVHHNVHAFFMPGGYFWPIAVADMAMTVLSAATAMRAAVLLYGVARVGQH